MDRTITIDHPYQRITLEFPLVKPVHPLNAKQWQELEHAERRLYKGEMGANAYTDVHPSDEGDAMLNAIWELAGYACEMQAGGLQEVARRVAAALAVLNFGTEFLLK